MNPTIAYPKLKKLIDQSRRHPIYWLETVVLELENRLFKLKEKQPSGPYNKVKRFGEMSALKKTIKLINKTMDEVPNE